MFRGRRRAQVGETITWIFATILILIILIFFIFGASMLGETRTIKDYKEKLTSESTFEGSDAFLKKSLYTYNLVESGSERDSIEKRLFELERENAFRLNVTETKKEISMRFNKK